MMGFGGSDPDSGECTANVGCSKRAGEQAYGWSH